MFPVNMVLRRLGEGSSREDLDREVLKAAHWEMYFD